MYYENMPLYPGMRPPCDASPCMKVRLFDDACGGSRCAPPMKVRERVTIGNPCRPGEQAEVVLGVDDCGNLVICVHRLWRDTGCETWDDCRPEPRPCGPFPPRRGLRRPPWDGCDRLCR